MAQAELVEPAPAPTSWSRALVAGSVVCGVLAIGGVVGGELGRFAVTGATYFPLIVLAILLQLSAWRAARIISWIWFWIVVVMVAVVSLTVIYAALVPLGTPPSDEVRRVFIGPLLAVLAIVAVAVVLAVTPGWAIIGRALGASLDRRSPAHAQGTLGALVISALAIAPLGLLSGRAPLVEMLNSMGSNLNTLGPIEQLLAQVYALVWTALVAALGTGWPTLRSLRGAAARLGVGPLRGRDVLVLAGISVGSLGVSIALDFLNKQLLGWLGLPLTDPTVITRLVPVAATPLGGIIVALCAGISEELLFRGLLQPRIGWLLADLTFAAAHAFQYGLDGLIAVFVLGAILAFVRARWNTTASMGVHATYDAMTFLLAAFGF